MCGTSLYKNYSCFKVHALKTLYRISISHSMKDRFCRRMVGCIQGVTKELEAELVPFLVYQPAPNCTSCASALSEPCAVSLVTVVL